MRQGTLGGEAIRMMMRETKKNDEGENEEMVRWRNGVT